MSSTSERLAHSVSCSMAPALKVSAAATRTFFPEFLSWLASFPTDVVLPTPFTPIIRTTDFLFSKSYASGFTCICSLRLSISNFLQSAGSFIFSSFTLSFKFSITEVVVVIPRSAIIRVSSSSS